MDAKAMALEKELECYKRKLPELLNEQGKYVLVAGDDLIGVFGTYEDALKQGYNLFGLQPFFVQQIQPVEQPQFITRLLDLACHT